MSIGKRLKEERERLKLSQTSFGNIGGMGKTTVIAWERGTAYPNAQFLELCATFGIDVLYVITGQRHENIASTPIELAFLRNCRDFQTNEGRMIALKALASMSSYNANEPYKLPANDHANLIAAQPNPPEYKDK